MRFDLSTLYFLAIGTLLLSACMTLWERHARPERSRELDTLATGYFALALGCLLATLRSQLPGAFGPAFSNLVMLTGYLLVLDGVAGLSGRQHRARSAALVGMVALGWAIGGASWQDSLWSYVSAFPIAVASAVTAWEVLRSQTLRRLRSRRVIAAITVTHAVVYTGRAFVLPLLAMRFGPDVVSIAGKVTMYEGVLYSVGLPMALLALIREEAHDKLLEASRTDYLTGLGNRRWFFEQGERLVAQSLSLLAFDLDHFKAINDRFGHATGDEVLKSFARAVRSVTGADAVLARIGGEEFAALLPGHGHLHAMKIGQSIASCFSQAVAHEAHCIGLSATVSIGVAESGRDGTTLGELLSAADRALYVAKASGRDRIEFASLPSLATAC